MGLKRMSGLKRGKPMRRTQMKPTSTRRVWNEAVAKRDAEGRCRICGHPGSAEYPLEAAHVVGREFDEKVSRKVRVVSADAVVPLDRRCHQMYDQRRLSLLGLLTMAELRHAIGVCKKNGIDVRRRITGSRDA